MPRVFVRCLAVTLLAVASVSCSSDKTTTQPLPEVTLADCPSAITISGLTYSPASCKIRAGGSVSIQVSSTHPLAPISTNTNPIRPASTGGSATTVFPTAGVYTYECTTHTASGMKGSITVVP